MTDEVGFMDVTAQQPAKRSVRRFNTDTWFLLASALFFLTIIFFDGLEYLIHLWSNSEEYSHAFMLPLVFGYLVWQKKEIISRFENESSFTGLAVVFAGLFGFIVGELSTLFIVSQYAFLFTLFGLLLSLMGWQSFKVILAPFLILFFIVPLPSFLYNNLSAALQLVSSQIGVEFIRWFGITVFLEGNVIDLGSYKLQVVEACSGLRYLFPLMSLGYIMVIVFKAALWKKVIIFLSTIPITVLMNSFRIGVIGVLVEHWGQSMAEGFLHDFEGWVVFMACLAVLLAEMWLLCKVGKDRMPLHDAFGFEMPAPAAKDAEVVYRTIPAPFYFSFALLAVMAVVSQVLPDREEIVPDRLVFDAFPERIGQWQGRMDRLEPIIEDALKLDDHIIADYSNGSDVPVNFYVAYYGSQRKGASAHSPKSCLPGGGWEMTQFEQQVLDGVQVAGQPLRVNRTLIQLGDAKQLVYYWFQQRGRVITNEYLVKWYLFWDSLTKNRSDGALVRLVAPVRPGQDVAEIDQLLSGFARDVSGELGKYIPD